jgi:hypothetical protein
MKINKTVLLWICFVATNLLAFIGFIVLKENKTLSNGLLTVSLLSLLAFLFISISEIVVSSKLRRSDKILWPILIVVLSTFGQIAYLVIRKRKI